MVESLISEILQKLDSFVGGDMLKTISSNLIEKISAVSEVEGIMENFKNEFILIQAVISKANMCLFNDPPYLAWLDGVRGVALKIEDTIDEYAYLLGQEAVNNSFFKKSTGFLKNLNEWNNIVTRIKQLEVNLEKLQSRRERYGIVLTQGEENISLNSTRNQHIINYSYFSDEDEIVGNVEEIKALTEWLTDGRRERTLISICGMGGVGKTTIVNSIYKKQEASRNFQCYAWVSVSQNYAFEDLLKSIMRQLLENKNKIPRKIDTMDLRQLIEKLKNELSDKKYLIILDDVWERDALMLCRAFPKNNQGSRVIITTRKEDVASLANKNHLIKLNTLSEEESWNLFCKKAFCMVPGNRCPGNLTSWGKRIVEKCQGLPLAIVVIGSLLSCRPEEKEWKLFYNQLSWEFSNNPHIKNVLHLSILDLPPHIKNCFFYCSLFPEDAEIRRKWISRLWIAEGFVEEKGKNITMEEVAEAYINELAYRSLIQVVQKNVHGSITRFKMHDILREIVTSTSKKERFSVVWDKPHPTLRFGEEARRLSVQKGSDGIEFNSSLRTLCSFLLFDKDISSSCIQNAINSFRLLRILSLRFSKIKEVPEIMYDLYNLHYLDLSYSKISAISKSLGNLQNLQTLDVRSTGVEKLPCELSKLKKLRHLFVIHFLNYTMRTFDLTVGASVPANICNLTELQSLQCIEASKDLVENLAKLKLLRKLYVWKVKQCFIPELCASVAMLPNLACLCIDAIDNDEVLDLKFLQPLPDLEKLCFRGRMEMGSLPEVFNSSLYKLMTLGLCWSELKEDPLSSFALMSNLVSLHLLRAYNGEVLTFHGGHFPKLKNLSLVDMTQLIQIEIQCGTMINLKYMELTGLQSLDCVPEGIYFLRSLQRMLIRDMPEAFVEKLRGDKSTVIQHIPHVIYRN